MDNGNNQQDDYEYQVDASRASVFGRKTQQHEITQNIVNEIIDKHQQWDIKLFVNALRTHPNIKEQTKLIEKTFSDISLIEDMIRTIVNPQKVMSKHHLKEVDALQFVNPIKQFMNDNFQFYQHLFLSAERSQLGYQIWFQFLQSKVEQKYFTSLGYLQEIFIPIIKYQYSSTSRITQFYQHHYSTEKPILIITHFKQATLSFLLRFTQYSAIFKTVFNIVLISLQQSQWKRSLNLLMQLCLSSINNHSTLDSHIQNVYWMAKEVSNNIQKDVHNTIFAFINAFVETNFAKACINRVSCILKNFGHQKGDNESEEHSLQYNIKVLAQLINIYYLLRKMGIDYTAVQMLKLKENIDQIYTYLNQMMNSMRNIQTKSTKFSNGQNIKLCLISRYQALNLLKKCLVLTKQYGQTIPQFQNIIDRSTVFQFLIACMAGNRWNNIAQCLIQKIVCIIVCPQMFKTNCNSLSRFLKFIVETFSNKKYMFLDSAKMINQGDIHFLYYISWKITAELDKLPGIIQISSQYEFWKKFVVNVLQKYQNDRFSKITQPVDAYDKFDKNDYLQVQIDELASIKEKIGKFEVNQKWTFRGQSQKHTLPRAGSAQNLIPKLPKQKSEKSGSPVGVHKSGANSIKKKTTFLQQGLLLTKVESFVQSPNPKSQIELHYENSSHSDSQVSHEEELGKKELRH